MQERIPEEEKIEVKEKYPSSAPLWVIASAFLGFAIYMNSNNSEPPLPGEILNANRENVRVFSVSAGRRGFASSAPKEEGYVSFTYKGREFKDYGFNGVCDRIIFSRANRDREWERIVLGPRNQEFQEHLPLYFEAREKATHQHHPLLLRE